MDLITGDLVHTSLGALALLVSTFLLIRVLIKSFKEGGVWQGLLGLVTGGVYTFAWGWLRSRRLQMTRTMLLWTACIVLGGVLVYVTGPAQMLRSIPWIDELGLVATGPRQQPAGKKVRKQLAQNHQKPVVVRKIAAGAAPQDADWNTQAAALWKDAQYADAKKAVLLLEKAIQADPHLAEAYNNRGNAYREMKQYALAMQDYNKAISLAPDLEKAYNNRGNIYFDQRNFELAIADYNKALSLKTSYDRAYLNRGLAYHALKKDALACLDFNKACELGDCDGIDWAKRSGICQ